MESRLTQSTFPERKVSDTSETANEIIQTGEEETAQEDAAAEETRTGDPKEEEARSPEGVEN